MPNDPWSDRLVELRPKPRRRIGVLVGVLETVKIRLVDRTALQSPERLPCEAFIAARPEQRKRRTTPSSPSRTATLPPTSTRALPGRWNEGWMRLEALSSTWRFFCRYTSFPHRDTDGCPLAAIATTPLVPHITRTYLPFRLLLPSTKLSLNHQPHLPAGVLSVCCELSSLSRGDDACLVDTGLTAAALLSSNSSASNVLLRDILCCAESPTTCPSRVDGHGHRPDEEAG
ncbi:hypothetical protein HMN09_00132200 [Mycena chlorophos]|uniref:Uncharacterized protein n=1 Tax=Mycena chlorophos TaxID=658473 RepID=A0A8H6TPM3_MYCCL|nr:hypothetical protein HMN09_00132200 [Mycena chlorophos]